MSDLDAIVVRTLVALACAAAICIAAYRKRLLDLGGAVAAFFVGVALVAAGGWWAGMLLVAFFLTSSLLSVSGHASPSRTWRQVLANGAPAVVFTAFAFVFGLPSLLVASAATIAAAAADTWATEVGRRSGATPRSVRSLRPVPIGASGAVSAPGTIASATGAVCMAIVAAVLAPLASMELSIGLSAGIVIAVSGTVGSLIDTLLGASIQVRYRCTTCGLRSETPASHDSHHDIIRETGLPWMTNDAVNVIACTFAGVAAALILR